MELNKFPVCWKILSTTNSDESLNGFSSAAHIAQSDGLINNCPGILKLFSFDKKKFERHSLERGKTWQLILQLRIEQYLLLVQIDVSVSCYPYVDQSKRQVRSAIEAFLKTLRKIFQA